MAQGETRSVAQDEISGTDPALQTPPSTGTPREEVALVENSLLFKKKYLQGPAVILHCSGLADSHLTDPTALCP